MLCSATAVYERGESRAGRRGRRGRPGSREARCSGSRLDPAATQPPPRYTEAALIKALEELGIGRPSTYASILSTIINDRGYVRREGRRLFPTELGIEVTDLLLPFFRDIMDVEFTAQMETTPEVEKAATGSRPSRDHVQMDLERAKKNGQRKAGEPTGRRVGVRPALLGAVPRQVPRVLRL